MTAGVQEINRCTVFFKDFLKDKNLSGSERTSINYAVQEDKYLFKALKNAKPSSKCTIL